MAWCDKNVIEVGWSQTYRPAYRKPLDSNLSENSAPRGISNPEMRREIAEKFERAGVQDAKSKPG